MKLSDYLNESFGAVISFKEFQQSFPQLASQYKSYIGGGANTKIGVSAKDEVTFGGAGGDGQKMVYILQRTNEKGESEIKTVEGSWGGANMFTHKVADSNASAKLKSTDAVLALQVGYKPYGNLIVHPDMINKMLPSNFDDLTAFEKIALVATKNLVSSYGGKNIRKNEFVSAIKSAISSKNPKNADKFSFNHIGNTDVAGAFKDLSYEQLKELVLNKDGQMLWDETIASLITKGYLQKNKALSLKGENFHI